MQALLIASSILHPLQKLFLHAEIEIAEADNPQCDVSWSGDPVRANVLKQKGITVPYTAANTVSIPAYFIDKDKHWTGFSARARVLLYNKDLLPANKVPAS